jgi:selenocysteine lyase/cysteine desulfurase
MISFFANERPMPALHKKLSEAGIVTSLRVDRSGQNYIRISPHFYNTDEELEKTVATLKS